MSTVMGSDRVQISNRWVHCDGTNEGFLNTGGGWDMYVNNGGNIYSANYGWLHDYFFRVVANCGSTTNSTGGNAINCYGGGNVEANRIMEVIDEGATLRLRTVRYYVNCNCSTDSCFLAGTQVMLAGGGFKPIEDIVVGDVVLDAAGAPTEVVKLWRPTLGDRSVYSIGGHVKTTEDHLVMTADGWACLNPTRYAERRFMVDALDGNVNSAIAPQDVRLLEVGSKLRTTSGVELPVEFIAVEEGHTPETQLYSLFTAAGAFALEGGVVVDGMSQKG